MKTQNKLFKEILAMLFITIILACSKDDGGEIINPPNPMIQVLAGISLDDFDTDAGEIGIYISARDIARKGYTPTNADIEVTATTGDYSQKVQFDAFNNIARLSFENENLSNDAKTELSNGVDITINVLDQNDNVLTTEDFTEVSFTSNPSIQEINANALDNNNTNVAFNNDVKYYVQIVSKDSEDIYGAPNSINFPNTVLLNTPIIASKLEDLDYDSENTETFTTYRFMEVPNEEGVFTISVHNGDDIHYLYIVPANSELRIQSKANLIRNGGNNTGAPPNYKFKIEKVDSGLYTITPTFTGNPLYLINDRLNAGNSDAEPAYFRVLSFDIDWDVQPIETKYVRPIVPANDTEEAYNKTLQNCSIDNLSEEVGQTKTVTTKEVLNWNESIAVSTGTNYETSFDLETEVPTTFFGVQGSIESNLATSYTFSRSKTTTAVDLEVIEETTSTEISEERNQSIPGNSALVIADLYQSYTLVKVPIAQRFKIMGVYQKNNESLTGNEIRTQLEFNGFTGVITDIQDDYIEVTIQGIATINDLVEPEKVSRNVETTCAN
ncbi:hypothetical protein ABN763_12020 [Spongiivirga sp. MCCC 1A20706]|uniref:hypothetical protein n=1 Tax=Spongiivirga sp. MCCC 1A20706 TaxID=3160963 RepID=UPI0039779331